MVNDNTIFNIIGANSLLLFQSEEGSLTELTTKVVLHYNAKACRTNTCLDLSFNQNHGRLVGNKCTTWDIKVNTNKNNTNNAKYKIKY